MNRILVLMTLSTFTLSCQGTEHQKKSNIAVFCGTHENITTHSKTIAYELGRYLGAHHLGLITGGGTLGLMKEVADGYISQASSLEAFQNILLQHHNDYHPALESNNIITVNSLPDRIHYFYEKADIFIILPGGLGTLHELINCLMLNRKAKKPIILLNIDDFWHNIIQHFNALTNRSSTTSQHLENFFIVNTLADCLKLLPHNQHAHPSI